MANVHTVRLAAGRHESPDEGVCVAELTSMLAGERFSDHPSSACPVITAFLRAYNDALDDRRRQDLYGIAADLVESRSPDVRVRARRAQVLTALAPRAGSLRARVARLLVRRPLRAPCRLVRSEAAGRHLGRIARRDADCHARVLETLGDLLGPPLGPAAGALFAPVPGRHSALAHRGQWTPHAPA